MTQQMGIEPKVPLVLGPEDQPEDTSTRLISLHNPDAPATATSAPLPPTHVAAPAGDLLSVLVHKLKRLPCAGIVLGLMAGVMSSIAAFIVKLVPAVNPVQIVVTRSVAAGHRPCD